MQYSISHFEREILLHHFHFKKWIKTFAVLSILPDRYVPLFQCFPAEYLLICVNVVWSIIMFLYRQGENGALHRSNNERPGGGNLCIPFALRWSPSRHLPMYTLYHNRITDNFWSQVSRKDSQSLNTESICYPAILLIDLICLTQIGFYPFIKQSVRDFCGGVDRNLTNFSIRYIVLIKTSTIRLCYKAYTTTSRFIPLIVLRVKLC